MLLYVALCCFMLLYAAVDVATLAAFAVAASVAPCGDR